MQEELMKSEHTPSRGLTPTVLPRSGTANGKYQFGDVLSEIWSGVRYQKCRGLPQLFNGYLIALI
jgi:hypothetical protein